jgi:hypothetical protein
MRAIPLLFVICCVFEEAHVWSNTHQPRPDAKYLHSANRKVSCLAGFRGRLRLLPLA